MDRYDEAIEWLVANPESIHQTWVNGRKTDRPECLFAFCSPSGSGEGPCGCLTMVRTYRDSVVINADRSVNYKLTNAVRGDKRIPKSIGELEGLRDDELRAALAPIAEWQRRLDREIRGVVNV
jgi:hypothetical protein